MEEAFANLRDAEDLYTLEQAARSRSEADWIVGMNATRAATIRLRSSFDGAVSLGRVQTPTLAILARREEEIRAFVPEPYWLVDAKFATDDGRALRGPPAPGRRSRACRPPRRPTRSSPRSRAATARSPSSRRRRAKRSRRCSTTSRRCSATPTPASGSRPAARSAPPRSSTRSTRRSPIRVRTRGT